MVAVKMKASGVDIAVSGGEFGAISLFRKLSEPQNIDFSEGREGVAR
jgi:hypothetical protein